jgi:hypothetical protein
MKFALHYLTGYDKQVGAPWPHQQRDLLQWCVQILELVRHRLESEHYPTEQQFIKDCCEDASALLELMEGWGWRVTFAAIRFESACFYMHPSPGECGGRVSSISWSSARSLGSLKLPRTALTRALLLCHTDINQLCRTILPISLKSPSVCSPAGSSTS